jgi:hypothetical protein
LLSRIIFANWTPAREISVSGLSYLELLAFGAVFLPKVDSYVIIR